MTIIIPGKMLPCLTQMIFLLGLEFLNDPGWSIVPPVSELQPVDPLLLGALLFRDTSHRGITTTKVAIPMIFQSAQEPRNGTVEWMVILPAPHPVADPHSAIRVWHEVVP